MKKYSILLVDNEEVIRKTISRDLTVEGYNVTTAENGERAIAILKEKQFDLVVTDLRMNKLDGFQVLKECKQRHPETSVIILTGYADMRSAIDGLRLGADDYMLKPCDIDELFERMFRCFEKTKLKRKIKLYEKILPVCSICKKIRDDAGKEPGKGNWLSFEEYITHKTDVSMSHGYCLECYEKVMDDINSCNHNKK